MILLNMKGIFLMCHEQALGSQSSIFSGEEMEFPCSPCGDGKGWLGVPVHPSDGVGAPSPAGGTGDALEGSKRSREKQIFRE